MTILTYAAQRLKAAQKKAKRKAKAERTRAKRTFVTEAGESLTLPPRWTLKTLREKLKGELHAAIRERDGNVCISCGKPGLVLAFRGGTWHAGHLFGVGPYRCLEFHPLNIASQCSQCNSGAPRRGGRLGNHAAYADAFIRRHGLETFQALADARHTARQWMAAELLELLNVLRREGLAGYSVRYYAMTGWTHGISESKEEK